MKTVELPCSLRENCISVGDHWYHAASLRAVPRLNGLNNGDKRGAGGRFLWGADAGVDPESPGQDAQESGIWDVCWSKWPFNGIIQEDYASAQVLKYIKASDSCTGSIY